MRDLKVEQLRQRSPADREIRELISLRAYEIYESRGGEFGHDLDDWLQAESEVLLTLIAQKAADLAAGSMQPVVKTEETTRQLEALLSVAAPRKRK